MYNYNPNKIKKEPQLYVLKKILMKETKLKMQLSAVKEAKIMGTLDHPNIIRYHTSFLEGDHLYILMEYAQKGDLYKILREQRTKKKYISEKDLWEYAHQIIQGVAYLHANNIIHRDIKCLNIFLSEGKTIKLGDMGVSKISPLGLLAHGTRVGTPLYLAPEVVKAQPYDHKIDIWAVGCALYHLSCLEPPFAGDNLITLGNAIANKKPKAIPHVYSSKFRNFVDVLLSKSPKQRPTALEAIKMIPAFVTKIKENKGDGSSQALL